MCQKYPSNPLGINKNGFFFSEHEDWQPSDLQTSKEAVNFIPWIQIHEILGNVEKGSTSIFIENKCQLN